MGFASWTRTYDLKRHCPITSSLRPKTYPGPIYISQCANSAALSKTQEQDFEIEILQTSLLLGFIIPVRVIQFLIVDSAKTLEDGVNFRFLFDDLKLEASWVEIKRVPLANWLSSVHQKFETFYDVLFLGMTQSRKIGALSCGNLRPFL